MILESSIQSKIIKWLKSDGYFVTKLMGTSTNGIPDVLAIKNGKTIFVEVKRPGRKAEPLQEYRMKELNMKGALAFVAHSVEETKIKIYKTRTSNGVQPP